MAQPAAAKKVLVVGGSGFLGLSICEHVIAQGWEAISLSRRGTPEGMTAGNQPAWAEKVQWETGDSLEPASYRQLLANVTDVVHTVGMISEANYKGVVNSKSFWDTATGAARLAGEAMGMKDRGNPLQERPRPTFEMINRDTAITLANEAAKIPSMESFVFVSAFGDIPFVDPRYISSKRQAEQHLFSKPEFRSIVFRPGFLYSTERTPLAHVLHATNVLTKPFAKGLNSLPYGTSLTTPPLHIDTLASAIVAAIGKEGLKGIFNVQDIQNMSREAHQAPAPKGV